jgi:hypothetical protein
MNAPRGRAIVDEARSSLTSWRTVVDSAYNKVYRPLRSLCNDKMSTQECLQRMHARASKGQFPWWVQTMLRDALDQETGLYGDWHHLVAQGSVMMCTIEKIGTREWRYYMCLLNGGGKQCHSGCGGCIQSVDAQTIRANPDWFKFVFVRDPIERFISAYLDKCARTRLARSEKHCEPLEVFLNGTDSKALRGIPKSSHMSAFASVFPLQWNIHFFPQSLYCDDLGRNIRSYSFRGNLNNTFTQQVHAVSRLVDARVTRSTAAASAADKVFPTTRRRNEGYTTHASLSVTRKITAPTVHILLQYFAIDYVELGLELPSWLADF